MFYIEDLGAHELHGPFTTRDKAMDWADEFMGGTTWRLLTDKQRQGLHDPGSLRLVGKEWR